MGAHEGDGGGFVRLTYTFEVVLIPLDGVEKSESAWAPAMCSVEQKGVRFNDDNVRRDELPALFACSGEDCPGALVVEVLRDEHREEGAGVDEDALHRAFSCLSA